MFLIKYGELPPVGSVQLCGPESEIANSLRILFLDE